MESFWLGLNPLLTFLIIRGFGIWKVHELVICRQVYSRWNCQAFMLNRFTKRPILYEQYSVLEVSKWKYLIFLCRKEAQTLWFWILLLGRWQQDEGSVLSELAFSVVSKVTCQFNPLPSWWWVCDRIYTRYEWSVKLLLTDSWFSHCWWGCQILVDRRNHTVWHQCSSLMFFSDPFVTLSHVCLTSCQC